MRPKYNSRLIIFEVLKDDIWQRITVQLFCRDFENLFLLFFLVWNLYEYGCQVLLFFYVLTFVLFFIVLLVLSDFLIII